MTKTSKIIAGLLVATILLIGVGYAAIQNITLNIGGEVAASPDQANFIVKFAPETEVSDASKVTASVTDELNATINVAGLSTVGETVTATYTVQNTSDDLSANLSVATTNSNDEYFLLDAELEKDSLVAGEATPLVVTVELLKAPIAEEEKATIGITLTASPAQPGEEGTSGGGAGGSDPEGETGVETTLASVTTANIGDYIDLRNNVVGTASTKDDWRIFYTEGDTIYAILADYLPNSTEYAANAGLDTYSTYSVYALTNGEADKDKLVTGLTTTSNWEGLANEISGATVTGSPTAELFMKSYNERNGTSLSYTDEPTLDSNTAYYDLYVPHTEAVDDCFGTDFATSHSEDDYMSIWGVNIEGKIYYTPPDNAMNIGAGIRPVVALPASTKVTLDGDIWTIPGPMTLASLTEENIGEYIDIEVNLIGTTSTSDDFRILYSDENYLYVILADYLPNETGLAESYGLETNSTYGVYSNDDNATIGMLLSQNIPNRW